MLRNRQYTRAEDSRDDPASRALVGPCVEARERRSRLQALPLPHCVHRSDHACLLHVDRGCQRYRSQQVRDDPRAAADRGQHHCPEGSDLAQSAGHGSPVRVGDQVFAIGNPLGFGMSVSAGIISGLNRNIGDLPYDAYMQTDAAINHGSSGGPLFDMEGHVIGVDTAMASPTEGSAGLGLARPSDSARFIVERLLKYGWVSPGWIGVKVQEVTPEMAAAMGAKQPEGSVVAWVLPGSPAMKAGIAVGDVVLKFGDDTPGDERALLRDIVRTPIGETVQVVVLHDGVQHSLPVTVASWPRDAWDDRDAPMTPKRPKISMPPDLGLALSAVPTADRGALGLEEGLHGVLVTGVAAGSDAEHRGMVGGDVILRVQDKPMAVPRDVWDVIHAAEVEKRQFVMMLVLPKVRQVPGPKWVALRLPVSDG